MPVEQQGKNGNAFEAVKLAVDFVKQILTVSSQLIALISGGIYFLRSQKVEISNFWYFSSIMLIISLVLGFLAFGSYIRQIEAGNLTTTKGLGRSFSLWQIISFLVALACIVIGGAVSAPKLT